MNFTTYHKLQKPLSTEKYNIGVHNTNADIIDSALNRLEQKDIFHDNEINNEIKRAMERENEIGISLDSEIEKINIKEKQDVDKLENLINEEKIRAISKENLIATDINNNKPNWDDKYTKNEIDNKFSALETNIDWKESVETFDDIATTYPNPENGWTVNVKDSNITYRFNGKEWIYISANAIPKATNDIDGLFSKEDHIKYEDANSKKHTHDNITVLNDITSDKITEWNNAKNHAESPHAPSNAEKNMIAGIQKNGVNLSVSSDRIVNIIVPTKTSELENDSGFINTMTDDCTYSANDVIFDDGKNAENKVGAINGITSDFACEDESIAASMVAVSQCFQSASDGKKLLASTITGLGVNTASDATFNVISNNIKTLATNRYNTGYNAGYSAGYNAGYSAGYNAGYSGGYNAYTFVTCYIPMEINLDATGGGNHTTIYVSYNLKTGALSYTGNPWLNAPSNNNTQHTLYCKWGGNPYFVFS